MNFPQLPEIHLSDDQKVYFASDFHLGAPSNQQSRERELKIVRWLNEVQKDAHTIFLMGDIFDFWFEYRNAIPKGFIRFQGKIAELVDAGINISFFTGNHDMWMFDYFTDELGVTIHRGPHQLSINNKKLLIGHGDGLGPGDNKYKILKVFFDSKFCQWLFARIHPNLGIGIANYWSQHSRISGNKRSEVKFYKEKEHLWQYCWEVQQNIPHDYYVFGHRHLPLDMEVSEKSRYINLGEWVSYFTYGIFHEKHMEIRHFEKKSEAVT